MDLKEITIEDVDISEFNTRKDLMDGQHDSTLENLAKSIEKQGLLNPITVFQKPDGRYAVIAGQRRLLACIKLGLATISALVRDTMVEGGRHGCFARGERTQGRHEPEGQSCGLQGVARQTWGLTQRQPRDGGWHVDHTQVHPAARSKTRIARSLSSGRSKEHPGTRPVGSAV